MKNDWSGDLHPENQTGQRTIGTFGDKVTIFCSAVTVLISKNSVWFRFFKTQKPPFGSVSVRFN